MGSGENSLEDATPGVCRGPDRSNLRRQGLDVARVGTRPDCMLAGQGRLLAGDEVVGEARRVVVRGAISRRVR